MTINQINFPFLVSGNGFASLSSLHLQGMCHLGSNICRSSKHMRLLKKKGFSPRCRSASLHHNMFAIVVGPEYI